MSETFTTSTAIVVIFLALVQELKMVTCHVVRLIEAFCALQLRIRFVTGHAQADDILRREVNAFLVRTVESMECS